MKRGIALIELIFSIIVIAVVLLSVPNLLNTTSKASRQVITQESISSAASHIDMALSLFWDENCTDPKYGNPILTVANYTPGLQSPLMTFPGMPAPSFPGSGSGSSSTPGAPSMPSMPDPHHHSPETGSLSPAYFFAHNRRPGGSISSPRKFAHNMAGEYLSATPQNKFGLDNETVPDDIDDLDNTSYDLKERESAIVDTEGDYKDQTIHIKTDVYYISDVPTDSLGAISSFNASSVNFNNPFDLSKRTSQPSNIKSIVVTLTSDKFKNEKVVLQAFSCNIGSSKLKEKTF